jgi:glycosyltransferase involved in cell wall biosynthesis
MRPFTHTSRASRSKQTFLPDNGHLREMDQTMGRRTANALPQVSVVMAAHNAERYIDTAIQSIRDQTLEDWELIIVDDHSTDRTPELIAGHAAEDRRIRVIRNEMNIRQVRSLNKGILNARADVVAIMDADDIAENRRLEEQVRFLESHPEVGMVGCLTDAFEEDPCITRSSGARTDGSWRDGNIVMAHPTMMVRRELYALHGLYDGRYDIAGDYEMQSRFGHLGVQMHVLPEVLLHYRVHDNSMTLGRRRTMVAGCIRISMRTLLKYRRSLTWRGYKALARYMMIWIYLTFHLEKVVPRSLMKRLWPGF